MTQQEIKQRALQIHDQEYSQGDRLTAGNRVIAQCRSENLFNLADFFTRAYLYGLTGYRE